MGRIDAIIDDKVIRDFKLAVVTRKGGKKGDFSKSLEEAMDMWTKTDIIENLKTLIKKSITSGPEFNNLVDALASHGDNALPTLMEITSNEVLPKRINYLTKAIKEISQKNH